jgi:hypothetical protein
MAIVSEPPVPTVPSHKVNGNRALQGVTEPERAVAPAPPATPEWGNAAPLALSALAVTTFILSMVNANAVNAGVAPVVYSVALMFGGGVQLIAAIILLRTGNTLTGVIFGGFAGFYLSLFALAQWFLKDVPAAQAGHALGLFLYAFGIFAFVLLAGSLRTNAVLVLTLALAVILVFFLAAGHYGANTTLIHWGGYLGIAAAACLFYTALSDLCEIAYGRVVFPVWSLAKR